MDAVLHTSMPSAEFADLSARLISQSPSPLTYMELTGRSMVSVPSNSSDLSPENRGVI